jgi:hypothetical protein
MKKVYLESSVFNRALDQGVTGTRLRAILADRGFEAATGLLTINELARTFLHPANEARAKALFSLLNEVDPVYLPEISSILQSEMIKLRTGAAVLPSLGYLQTAAARTEVARLANGAFDQRASEFLAQGARRRARDREMQQKHLDRVRSVGDTDPIVASLRTFEEVWAYFLAGRQFPSLIREILKGAVSAFEAEELAQRLDQFPCLAAAVRSDVYVHFILIAHSTVPGRDKLDDYKHALAAAYTSAFCTADKQDAALRHIVPHLELVRWSEISALMPATA